MSFSTEVKEELGKIHTDKSCCLLSELNALTQGCGSLILHGGGRVSFSFSSENITVAKRIFILLKKRLSLNPEPTFHTAHRFGKRRICTIKLTVEDSKKLMIALHMLR